MNHILTRCWAPVLRDRLDSHGYPGISRGYITACGKLAFQAWNVMRENAKVDGWKLLSHQPILHENHVVISFCPPQREVVGDGHYQYI